MNKYRKKYQNVLEKKSHLNLISKDHNTIESLESQALDAFCVESSGKEYYMQRMGQLQIMPTRKRRYILKNYKKQARLTFLGKPKKIETRAQTLDNFIIKRKEKPKNIVQRPVYFKIYSKPHKVILREEQLDSFMCPRKLKPELREENVFDLFFEKYKKLITEIESLNNFKLEATGKFFNNHPKLREGGMFEIEFLKIKAPLKQTSANKLFIPHKLKKIKYTDIVSEKSADVLYIINKVKVFDPLITEIKNASHFLIEKQPKKTSFTELTSEQLPYIIYDIIPKLKTFDMVSIESLPELFIPVAKKKRYYSAIMTENMSVMGQEKENCLEIDPNEEIFIPNVYDMLLIQNYWDDLVIKSFRVCIRPKWWKSTRDLALVLHDDDKKDPFSSNNLENRSEEEKRDEIIKDIENLVIKDNSEDTDVLQMFKENSNRDKGKRKKEKEDKNDNNNLYENKDKDDNNPPKISLFKDQGKQKENKGKGVSFNIKKLIKPKDEK